MPRPSGAAPSAESSASTGAQNCRPLVRVTPMQIATADRTRPKRTPADRRLMTKT
jgi:hypothetical protein